MEAIEVSKKRIVININAEKTMSRAGIDLMASDITNLTGNSDFKKHVVLSPIIAAIAHSQTSLFLLSLCCSLKNIAHHLTKKITMETTTAYSNTRSSSKKMILAGKIITGFCVLFLLFDSIMKIIREAHSVTGSAELGWPDNLIMPIGVVLLICTLLYVLPRTAVLGAILITGYLGGAISIMLRAGQPFIFPLIFGILVWGGIFLRSEKLRSLIPLKKD